MRFANATNLDRKSGGAQSRDLRFSLGLTDSERAGLTFGSQLSVPWGAGDQTPGCRVMTVISGGQRKRKGRLTAPMPRLT